jgi:hypothetical protein
MQAIYSLKIQAIRSKGQQARLYVYFPLPLAAAIGLQAGEEVQWELLDRAELHLVRKRLPQLQATQRLSQGDEIPMPSPTKQTAKDKRRRRANASSSRSAS